MGLPVLLRLCNLSWPWQRLYSLVEELSRSKPACTTISPHLISSLSAKFSWPHVLVLPPPYTLQIVESTVKTPSASVTWRLRSDKAGCCVDLRVLQRFGSVFTWHGSPIALSSMGKYTPSEYLHGTRNLLAVYELSLLDTKYSMLVCTLPDIPNMCFCVT